MLFPNIHPHSTAQFEKLKAHFSRLKSKGFYALFEEDKKRFDTFSIDHGQLLFDYSKQFIDCDTLDELFRFADACGLTQATDALFGGEPINATEGRRVMHMALRSFGRLAFGESYMQPIQEMRNKMKQFCADIHSAKRVGYTGKAFRYVVNIGIGGSDLGPAMVCDALGAFHDKGITPFFVSNVDGSQLHEVLRHINVEETLFLVASKTFTTQETMQNARQARSYVVSRFGTEKSVAYHFAAISANTDAIQGFGIDQDSQFTFWDWVGGRFSLWSSIGLSIALTVGYHRFEKLLEGAEDIDVHFRKTNPNQNIPLIMALLSFAYGAFFDVSSEAVLPYAQYLHRFPAYLQQAAMESNGKYVDRNGKRVDYATNPVIWGEPGTNGQHAFYQLLHQGTSLIPADFIAFAQIPQPYPEQQRILLAHCLAQTEGLMKGKTIEEVTEEMQATGMDNEKIRRLAPFRTFEGNRPTTTVLFNSLTPFTLGQLIALYEHKIFILGVLWNIYSFDQWGVELGKQLAHTVLEELQEGKIIHSHDSSTAGLLGRLIAKKSE